MATNTAHFSSALKKPTLNLTPSQFFTSSPPATFQNALNKLNSGQYNEALNICKILLEKTPHSWPLLEVQGRAYHHLGSDELALQSFDAALKYDINHKQVKGQIYCYRGKVLQLLERVDESIISFNSGIECDPTFGLNYYYRGLSFHVTKRYQEAINDYDHAIKLGPSPTALKELNDLRGEAVKLLSIQTKKDLEKKKTHDNISIRESYNIDWKNLQLNSELGKGSFGIVYRGTFHNETVAIKKMSVTKVSKESNDLFLKECHLMAQLHFPNIVRLIGICAEPKSIVMEYMPFGSLFDLLHKQNIQWKLKISIAANIASGLHYLHQRNILHRDIKSSNVLLGKDYLAKLSDYGLSILNDPLSNGRAGTTRWMAPELHANSEATCSKQSDVFSFGITLCEIATQKLPFEKVVKQELVPIWIMNGRQDHLPSDCPEEYAKLTKECQNIDPTKRPGAEEICQRLETLRKNWNEKASFTLPTSQKSPNLNLIEDSAYQSNLNSSFVIPQPSRILGFQSNLDSHQVSYSGFLSNLDSKIDNPKSSRSTSGNTFG